ncbi:hypothetical protein [Pantoea stewartii]|nr:hypothetical protein [Pantoea stewartii]
MSILAAAKLQNQLAFGIAGNSYPVNNKRGYAAQQKRAAQKRRRK